jgi:glycerophosphoryl diester phosphodiesterase
MSPIRILLMLSFLSFLACKITERRPVPLPPDFDWQGHRGSRGLQPENTVPAFLQALSYEHIKTLELDLAVSKDKQLIVSHEPWFNPAICRRPNGDSIAAREAETLLLYELTAVEIRAYDCGQWGNPRFPRQEKTPAHKPTLREVVEAVRLAQSNPPVRWNIEIKSQPDWDGTRTPPIEEFARLVYESLISLNIKEVSTVQSFDRRPLQILHRLDTTLQLALLVENVRGLEANLRDLGFKPAIYSPYYQLVDKALVERCHAWGIKLVPWTVNDVYAMRRLIRLGVDGIITDYPDLINKVGAVPPHSPH